MKLGLGDINEFQLQAMFENAAPVFNGVAGKRLKLMRMERKLDQAQLAELLGVNQKTICGAENGTRTQRNPIPILRLLGVFGTRRTVFILSGQYSGEFAASENKIRAAYWESKHAPQGYRVKHQDRPHLSIQESKHDLLMKVKRLMEENQQLKSKKDEKPGKD